MIENPELGKPNLSAISENDRKLIDEFNKTDSIIPDYLIQNFFEEQSDRKPDKTAVISEMESLTYKELNTRANQLARHLLNLDLIQGDVVGICLERSVEMIVSVLAVLKAGGCYLPLDPSFPDERINYMLENSRTKILISQNSLKDKFRHFPDNLLVILENENNKVSSYSNGKPHINLTPDSFAYILYTSGSTGRPKGVKIHHQAVVNFIIGMINTPGINDKDILLAVTTFSFDISVLELFLPLSRGTTVIVADKFESNNGAALIDLIEKYSVTYLQATPSLWNFLLATGWKGNKNLKGICGGESLSSDLVRGVLHKVGEFWNFYGPTETTIWSTGIKISNPDPPVFIGKPIDNTKIYILNNNNKQLPVGATGEICNGGLGVAKGYFKNTEITAKKFIPFGGIGIIYRTGDLGRFHEDGNIEFLGRIDRQIKIRGFRIEPGEIESILLRLPGVREAVVKLQKFDENDERLVAFLNVSDEHKMSEKEIIDTLSLTLPQYMVPILFQKSDGFPRLPNGKINTKTLFFETYIPDQKEKEETRSLSPTEEIIYNIWFEALKIKNISVTDNFFALGGNSLLALTVFSKIESAFNIEMGLRVFFDSPRIIDLAQEIDIILQKQIENNWGERNHQSKLNIIKGNI